jgi:hypothetical protein
VCFGLTDQLLNVSSAFVKYLRKKWEYNEEVHQPFTELKPIQLGERSSLTLVSVLTYTLSVVSL